jgi:hypothetical protein
VRRGHNLSTVALAVVALLAVAVAASRRSDAGTNRPTLAPPPRSTTTLPPIVTHRRLTTFVLTLDRLDHYTVTSERDTLHVAASAHNSDKNLRELMWDPGIGTSTDQEACSTWTAESGIETQQGFAFRVRKDGTRWRTVTVTKNTLFGMTAWFNVHTWDSARATAIQTIGHFQIGALLRKGGQPSDIAPLPWKACGRIVGDVISLKVWLPGQPEPRWSDPSHTGSIRLPAGWVFSGHPAWYAGHLPPGGTADYAGISARPLPSRG